MYQGLADSSACTEGFDLSPSLICMVNSATILEDQYAILQISPLDKIHHPYLDREVPCYVVPLNLMTELNKKILIQVKWVTKCGP